ncbi:aldo/keto reductase [Acinetobacter ursingii]|uniref:aldo/keto reductase n=1 Tax=Acinetobacter ursingii TaxID=108980 RepID=UPI0021CD5F73|nr:aldo/keto reductase [Acinetobacter ursingii]MCU4482537.1 aldo/keto reductase [Acinetobacter ursingii]MCU4506823.1 aldo/keto reductase [Acinetobacter ursingii]
MRLELGTVQFGMDYGVNNRSGIVEPEDVKYILDFAKQHDILNLDTATAYGRSETVLGEIGVNDWKIITKIGELNAMDALNEIELQVAQSLQRLNVNSLYGLLLHRPLELKKPYGDILYEGLLSLKKRGLIEKIGVSVYETSELVELYKKFAFDIVQLPFNVLDNRFLVSGVLDKLKDKGVEIHARSVFMQGLLLMDDEQRPAKFDQWTAIWQQWSEWLNKEKLSKVQGCLAYIKQFSQIDYVVVGVDSYQQIFQIVTDFECDYQNVNFDNLPKVQDPMLLNPSNWSSL